MVRPSASIDPNCAPRHAPEEPVVGAPTATGLLHVWLAYTCGWTREENSRIGCDAPRGCGGRTRTCSVAGLREGVVNPRSASGGFLISVAVGSAVTASTLVAAR